MKEKGVNVQQATSFHVVKLAHFIVARRVKKAEATAGQIVT